MTCLALLPLIVMALAFIGALITCAIRNGRGMRV